MPSPAAPGAGSAAAAATIAAAGAAAGRTDTASQAVGETGSGGLASRAPAIIGDQGTSSFIRTRSGSSVVVSTATRGPFKIAENESVLPMSRVFIYGNYYNGVGRGLGQPGYDIYRNTFGFEYAFLEGAASFGMRGGWQEATKSVQGIDGFSDTTLIGKWAFYNDRETGNVLTGGLAVTVPTGKHPVLADGKKLDPTLIQPFLGTFLSLGDAYIQGFTGLVFTTDNRDATLYNADVAFGYRLYNSTEDQMLT